MKHFLAALAALALAACVADRTRPEPGTAPAANDEGRCPTCSIP